MMKEEIRKILKMVEEKKITAGELSRILCLIKVA